MPSQREAALRGKGTWSRVNLIRLLALAGVIAVVAAILLVRPYLPSIQSAGYPGVFLLSLVASASIVVPIPGIASVCAAGAFLNLNPVALALLAGAGEALGELIGYLAGIGGRGLVGNPPLYGRLEGWVKRRGGFVLLIFALVPNPFFDIVGIAAGTLRYPLHLFLPTVAVGKTLKSLGVVYACTAGLEDVLRWLQRLNG